MEKMYNWFFIEQHFIKCTPIELNAILSKLSKESIALKAGGIITLNNQHIRSVNFIITPLFFNNIIIVVCFNKLIPNLFP